MRSIRGVSCTRLSLCFVVRLSDCQAVGLTCTRAADKVPNATMLIIRRFK